MTGPRVDPGGNIDLRQPDGTVTKPRKPIEMIIAEQANDAIAQGADAHAVTEELGRMVRHLRANPQIAHDADDAISQGADAGAVASHIGELARTAPENPLVARQRTNDIPPRIGGSHGASGSWGDEDAPSPKMDLVNDASRAVLNGATFGTSDEGMAAVNAGIGAVRGKGKFSDLYNENVANERGRLRDFGKAHSVAAPALEIGGGIASTLAGGAALKGLGLATAASPIATAGEAALSGAKTGAAVGAASGAGNAEGGILDRLKGAMMGGAEGAAIGGVAPSIARGVSGAGSKAITALGLRPSGRTALQLAEDATAVRPSIGPQANVRLQSTGSGITPPSAPVAGNINDIPQPSPLQVMRAAVGSGAQKAGVETSRTRALREFARRMELDGVDPKDAIAFAEQNAGKPVAPLDLGGGNVAGLARTAKDVPSTARRQIPDFLHGRSGGSFGNEGATLQRVTGDVEKHLGLKPEDYYSTIDEMMAQQKSLSKPAYDKVRNAIVDDPEILELFDIPEFQFAHQAVRDAERIRPGGAKILPLSNKPVADAEQLAVRDGQGRLRSDLGKVSDSDLDSEWQRLAELNRKEEALHGGVAESGYREDYHELPKTEKYGVKGKEDLPDADGNIDPERLAADNKIVSDYRRSTVARKARQQAMDRIQEEIDKRPQPWEGGGADDPSFDFGENAKAEAGTVKRNPQTVGTLDKMRQYTGELASGMLNSRKIERNTARAMLERLDAVTQKLDEQFPDYAEARAGYAGRARSMDAYEAGKSDFLNRDPREMATKIAKLSPGEADLYRRGGYDALRSSKLTKMDDGANIGAFLEKNPDIRDRLAVLAKQPDDATGLRSDLNVERAMGDRKNQILGGPNTAERLIEHESTKPRVTVAGDIARKVPGVGKLAGGLIDNTITRRSAEQTSDVMGQLGRIMTSVGPDKMRELMDELEQIQKADAGRSMRRAKQLGAGAGVTAGSGRRP